MARVTRSSVLLKIQDILGLQAGSEQVPVIANNSIQPVLDIHPKFTTVLKTATIATTSGITVYTTPTDKDFYLTFISLAFVKDVNCDNATVYVQIVTNDGTIRLPFFENVSLVAEAKQVSIDFSNPIKLSRNNVISLVGTFTAGALTKRATIGGFILE